MSKYSFDRIQPNEFESMAQALLEKTYRVWGNLIQFGSGKDGGREATWSQPANHPQYLRPENHETDIVKEWVFQVKYHDINQRGWKAARDAVVEDLDKELEKIIHKYAVPCHAYVMITNVPFTGARSVGTRDLIIEQTKKWRDNIPEIHIWDAADLSRMLDANEDVRTAYIDTILAGDTIKALYNAVTSISNRKHSAFRAYLKFITEREKSARAEEAGDEPNLPLAQVFIDLTFKANVNNVRTEWSNENQRIGQVFNQEIFDIGQMSLTGDPMHVKSSFALFYADHPYTLFLGGPGSGKSTLTQFLSLYQAARIVDLPLSQSLVSRLKLPEGKTFEDLEASCCPRFPFRIELRLYAKWISKQQDDKHELARYITESLINPNVSSTLEMDDIFELASKNPVLIILDGLDEVPNSEMRRQIIDNLQIFLRRIEAETGNTQVILSSRPKGYSGEFKIFEPITWELNELERPDFDEYCDCWLKNRILDSEERRDAQERINRGMMAESVQRLARSLLQATVILTIVRRKVEIPHQRNSLYAKYVEVIFNREKEKSEIVREHENALLRLHERVGYELHCKMEQTRAEAIDRETFRGYIFNALEDYSAPLLGNKTIKNTVDEIIDAATDRLCLLIGRGKDQTDVDFVVQQYREYFAALYLTNHPDADPNNVFDVLVLRGAYWAYVLQFYVAQAHPNQQIRWVTCIPDHIDEESNIDTVVRKIRTNRAILNVLPEFTHQRRQDFERTLKVIFALETRWAWLNQELTIEILKLIPSVNILQLLSVFFGDWSLADNTILSVEIWLLTQLASPGSQESIDIDNKIQLVLQQEKKPVGLIASAFRSNRKFNLSNYLPREIASEWADSNIFDRTGNVRHKYLCDLFSYQDREKQLEILTSSMYPLSWYDAALSSLCGSLEIPINILESKDQLEIIDNSLSAEFHDYLFGVSHRSNFLKQLAGKHFKSQGLFLNYFKSIVQAIENPTCIASDEKARLAEQKLSNDIRFFWRSEYILGPSSLNFSSTNEWMEFKQKIHDASSTNPNWICEDVKFNELNNAWICLLFHPEHWPLLVEEDLVSIREYEYLLDTTLGRILKLPLVSLDIFQTLFLNNESSKVIPLYKIINIVRMILEKEGLSRVNDARLLGGAIYQNKVQIPRKEELELLLSQLSNLPSLSAAWVPCIIRLSRDVPGFNINFLLDYWEGNEVSNLLFPFAHKETSKWNKFLKKLLRSDRASAVRLGMLITAHIKPVREAENILRDKLLGELGLHLNNDTHHCFYLALLNLSPSLEEFALWTKPEVIGYVRESSQILTSISQRFMIATRAETKIDSMKLREKLSIFIANRCDYPAAIVQGALEAILKIDEANLQPLDSKSWQQCSND
jgi:hypothetical protein